MSKFVVVKHTVEVVHEVPDDFNENDINFFFNESLHCASNLAEDLKKQKKIVVCAMFTMQNSYGQQQSLICCCGILITSKETRNEHLSGSRLYNCA